MSFEKIEIYHSAIRLSRYLKVADNNREKALQYYNANVFVAQNSLPLLHFFEVAFRNAVHSSMSTHFGNSDWLVN